MAKNARRASVRAAVITQFHDIIAAARLRDRANANATERPAAPMRLLALVRQDPGINLSGRARRLGLEISTMSNLVSDLIEADLLRTFPDASNRRRKLGFPRPRADRCVAIRSPFDATTGLLALMMRALCESVLHQWQNGLASLSEQIPAECRGKVHSSAQVVPLVDVRSTVANPVG